METYYYDVYSRITSAKTWRNGALGAVVDGPNVSPLGLRAYGSVLRPLITYEM
jgi:hypothetical protein